MPEFSLSNGKILERRSDGARYRILFAEKERVVLCEMDISTLNVFPMPTDDVFQYLEDGEMDLCEDEGIDFDISNYTEDVVRRFNLYRDVFFDVDETYGPDYLRLMGKGPKPQLKAILEKYNMKTSTFCPLLVQYLQSGLRESSLLDKRALGPNKGKKYSYEKKPGRPSRRDQGIPPSPEMYEHFDAAIRWMKGQDKKKRRRTIRSAYIWLCREYYRYPESVGGEVVKNLLPENERPTEWQFRDYVRATIDEEKMDVIRTSVREVQNDKRLKNSNVLNGVAGPADEVECDACEVPYSFVSGINSNETIGDITLYIFIDTRTRIILAYSLGLEQNSVLGITNLFLNLADDKQKLCAKYGINMDKETIDSLWPSNVFPRRIRCDRGSEFTSAEMERICNKFHIELQLAPPAMGSAKGVVEHLFSEIIKMLDPYLEGHGRITKRHGEKYHEEACLTVSQFNAIILNVILAHNRRQMVDYPLAPEIDQQGVLPTPADLWKYHVDTYGAPRPIRDIKKYVQYLMTPIDVKVSEKGLLYNGLWYLADDPELDKERYAAGEKRVPFEHKTCMDMRCVGAIYYLRGETLMRASLKPVEDNMEYADYTMAEWEKHLDSKRDKKSKAKQYNDQIDCDLADSVEAIVDSAKKPGKSSTKNITKARSAERQRISAENKIANRLPDVMPGDPPALPDNEREDAPQDAKEVIAYKDFKEALEDYNENR